MNGTTVLWWMLANMQWVVLGVTGREKWSANKLFRGKITRRWRDLKLVPQSQIFAVTFPFHLLAIRICAESTPQQCLFSLWISAGDKIVFSGGEQKEKKLRGNENVEASLTSNLSDVFTTVISFVNLQPNGDRFVINFNSAAQFRTLNRLFYHQP